MDEVRAELAKPSKDGRCSCQTRKELEVAGVFIMRQPLSGWIFPADALRTSTWRARYQSGENHDGEPVTWVTCPFCGYALPEPPDSSVPTNSEGPE